MKPSLSALNFIGEGRMTAGMVLNTLDMMTPFRLEDITPESLRVEFQMDRGSVLIFLNGPTDRLEFSLDGVFGRTGPKFEGFHSIPTGIHLISYRISEGAFVSLIMEPHHRPQVSVLSWSQEEEIFQLKNQVDFKSDQMDKLLEYSGLISYERFMDMQEGIWRTLTRFIKTTSIQRIFSDLKVTDISSEALYEITPMTGSHHSLLQGLKDDEKGKEKMINFTRIPSLKEFAKTGINITQCAMDKSPIFKSLNRNISDLLAELQVAFILLIFCQNFEGFEQWIDIVSLLLNSFDLGRESFKDYRQLFEVMREHLEMCPDDFFVGLMNENKLYKLISTFASNCDGFDDQIPFYEGKFGWKFNVKQKGDGLEEFDDPEDSPVIVE